MVFLTIISSEIVEEILPYCIDNETRLAMVFGRFAGVRIPSEIQNLRWDDIEKDRFHIRKGKTGSRVVPLFERAVDELMKNRNNQSEWFPKGTRFETDLLVYKTDDRQSGDDDRRL